MLRTLAVLAFSLILAVPADARPKPRAEAADASYRQAKSAFEALKKDSRRRKFREPWLAIAQRFESLAERYPKSARAPQALYEAANLYAELSRVSLAKRDLRRAVESYKSLVERFPRSPLADDAQLELARIYRDRLGDTAKAADALRAAAALKGDRRAVARAELAALNAADSPARERTTALRAESTPARRAEPDKVAAREERDSSETRRDGAVAGRRAQTERAAPVDRGRGAVASDDEDDDDADSEARLPRSRSLDPERLQALQKVARGTPVPLSVQVGLKVRRVVIDPGHGGHDTGAIGPSGVREKDVTLAIARRLQDRLQAAGLEALLTRADDTFVSLEERARFANRSRGDLFVSIHCNAYPRPSMRGTETYTLNVTGNRYAMRLAARENATSERTVGDLQFILADLATKANTDDSQRLARAVQAQLVEASGEGRTHSRDLGVKQALFYVLLGARMPSVLVESAFISNPQDELLLASPEHQQRLAAALADGVLRFSSERDALASME